MEAQLNVIELDWNTCTERKPLVCTSLEKAAVFQVNSSLRQACRNPQCLRATADPSGLCCRCQAKVLAFEEQRKRQEILFIKQQTALQLQHEHYFL